MLKILKKQKYVMQLNGCTHDFGGWNFFELVQIISGGTNNLDFVE
jgi:hypothetical protein